jgi:hypothetical protein
MVTCLVEIALLLVIFRAFPPLYIESLTTDVPLGRVKLSPSTGEAPVWAKAAGAIAKPSTSPSRAVVISFDIRFLLLCLLGAAAVAGVEDP